MLVDINTEKLLGKLEEIVTCPITKLRIKIPLCGTDLCTYEKDFIIKWLTTKFQTSPVSRIPMTMNDIIGNNGMKQLIEAMDKFKIGNSVIKREN